MKNLPKISIVIPCYNVQKYIDDCLISIINQTYNDYEIILINDGSTDDTEKHIKIFIDKHKDEYEIKYFYQENKGLAAARNKGIKESSGELIAFIDSDDKWTNDSLEKKFNQLINTGASIIYSDATFVYEEYRDTKIKTFKDIYKKFHRGNIWPEILRNNFLNPNVLIRKSVFQQCGLFDESLKTCEDYDLWIRISSKGYIFDYVDEPLAYYTVRHDSLSRNTVQMFTDMIKVYSKVLSLYLNNDIAYKIAFKQKFRFQKYYYESKFVSNMIDSDYKNAKIILNKYKYYSSSRLKYYLKYLILMFFPNLYKRYLRKNDGGG